MFNGKRERSDDVADATAEEIVITWTANEPTAAITQTIADGDSPTVAETGQAIANLNAQITKLIADMAALRTAVNA